MQANPLSPPVDFDEKALTPYPNRKILALFALHAVFGILFHASPIAATIHAAAVGILAFYFVISSSEPRRYLLLIAYAVSSEVLWRMSKATIPWMYSEYLVLFIAIFGLMRIQGTQKAIFLPLYYVVLLLPSIMLTFLDNSIPAARSAVAFNLAGPIALGAGMFAVSRLKVDRRVIIKAILYSVFPIASIVAITVVAVYFEGVSFVAVSDSNAGAAGGYSPNQVSSIISCGAAAILLLIFVGKEYAHSRKLFYVLFIIFVVQMLFTMSRGGTFNLAAFMLFGLPYLFQRKTGRVRFIVTIVIGILVIWIFVLPFVDDMTFGALTRRYEDESTTHRELLMQNELLAFYDSPVLGHGPGNSMKYQKMQGYFTVHSHTEYTRLLAEHGILGGIGMLALVATFVLLFFRADRAYKKGVILGAAAWIFMYFTHSASRTVQFAFMGIVAVLMEGSYEKEEVKADE